MDGTDGVAFVGPGSEWFWIALQFFALAGTFYAIYRQLRAQQVEISKSTKAQLSLGYHNAIMLGQRPLEMLLEDESLARIVSVGYSTPEALDEVESIRFGTFMFLQVNAWEFFFYQHRDRQIPKELWVGADDYYQELITLRPSFARFWSQYQHTYAEPFHSYVAEAFARSSASNEAPSGSAP